MLSLFYSKILKSLIKTLNGNILCFPVACQRVDAMFLLSFKICINSISVKRRVCLIKGIMCAMHYVIGQNLLFRSQFHAERVEDYLVRVTLTSSRFLLLFVRKKVQMFQIFCVTFFIGTALTSKSFFFR